MKSILLTILSLSSIAAAEPLFNGKDLTGWTPDVPAADGKPETPPSFIVRDGLLVSMGEPKGHLVSDKSYSNYKLEIEYRFVNKGGNCGILIHASEPRNLYKMFPKSIEVQMNAGDAGDFWCIGENIEVPDMEKRRPRKEGQNFGGGPADARRILNLNDDAEKPLGEWNTMVIEAKDAEVIVHVNGKLVNHGVNSTATSGKLALQAEGTEVEFRKLELTPLKK